MQSEPRHVDVDVSSGSIHDDRLAAALRGFGPLGLLAIVVILLGNFIIIPLSGVLVLVWAQISRTPWREIGYVRPRSWIVTVAVGIVFGVVFKLLMKAVVMPLLGAPAINEAYQHLQGNTAAMPAMLFAVIVGAGFGEETLYRGYLFERLRKLLGAAAWTKVVIVLITAALFAVAHYPEQGVPGVQQAAVVGLVYGIIFSATWRIWLLIVAHAAFNVAALAIIYWNLEWTVAHSVFDKP